MVASRSSLSSEIVRCCRPISTRKESAVSMYRRASSRSPFANTKSVGGSGFDGAPTSFVCGTSIKLWGVGNRCWRAAIATLQHHRRKSYILLWFRFRIGFKRLLVPMGVIPGRVTRSVVAKTGVARMVRKGAVWKTRSATKARPIATRLGSTATVKCAPCPLGLHRCGNHDGYRQQSEQH